MKWSASGFNLKLCVEGHGGLKVAATAGVRVKVLVFFIVIIIFILIAAKHCHQRWPSYRSQFCMRPFQIIGASVYNLNIFKGRCLVSYSLGSGK